MVDGILNEICLFHKNMHISCENRYNPCDNMCIPYGNEEPENNDYNYTGAYKSCQYNY